MDDVLTGAMSGWLVEEPSTLTDVLLFGCNTVTRLQTAKTSFDWQISPRTKGFRKQDTYNL
jgi:hypothetical protein